MFRQQIAEKGFGREKDFRWRGGEVSRIEGFTDAVFAFAITLLVVSLEVPKSFEGLIETMQGFAAFGVTFTAIVGIWFVHYLFFRRYGMQDGVTIVLNAFLLFVVLFYIYPLKFLFTLLINYGLLKHGLGFDIKVDIAMANAQWTPLMVIYSIGFLAVFLVFALLHWHAYRKRDELELNPIEILTTRSSLWAYGICVIIALFSITIASIGGRNNAALAGWIYFLIGPAETVNGIIARKQASKLRTELEAPTS
jgi:uncharacterized membrane protein